MSCSSDQPIVQTPQPPPPPTHKYSYLALGDSYTIGERVGENERFPNQLAAALRKKGVDLGDPTIIARTGWTTAELNQGIKQANVSGNKYDLVTLLIGVNNQYRHQDINIYPQEFTDLLNQSITFAKDEKSHVIVVSIPDWGSTPFAEGQDRKQIGQEIDKYNGIARSICMKNGVAFVDITPGSKKVATDDSLVAIDGLHPTGKLYATWVAAILPVAEKALTASMKG